MTKYEFEMVGISDLIMHKDCIIGQSRIADFHERMGTKAKGHEKGSDRWPAWTWTTKIYHDGEYIAMPRANVMKSLSEAGKQIKVGMSNLKETVMTSLHFEGNGPNNEYLDFYCSLDDKSPMKKVGLGPISKLVENEQLTFYDHVESVEKLGFELFAIRAQISKGKKHIRVRPCFKKWKVIGQLVVRNDDAIKEETLRNLFFIAGDREGVCDWRPNSPSSSGTRGRFKTNLKRIE